MAQARKILERGGRLRVAVPGSLRPLAILTVLAGIPFFLLAALMPPAHVVPLFSLLMLAAAGGTALFAWLSEARRDLHGISAWDIAGVLAFLGFAAGMLSEAAPTAQLFGIAMVSP